MIWEKNICGLENKRLHINACKKMSFYAFYVFNTLQFIEPVWKLSTINQILS